MKIGDKYSWYDGGGYWGNWTIEILDVFTDTVSYRLKNAVTKDDIVNLAKKSDVEDYIRNGDWEQIKS